MNRISEENLKKLAKYPKSEIIKVLGKQYQSERIVSRMLAELEDNAFKKVLNEQKTAMSTENKASKAYTDWLKEMCLKYGDGKTVKISMLPQSEINRGANLETILQKATENTKRLDKKLNKLLNIEVSE